MVNVFLLCAISQISPHQSAKNLKKIEKNAFGGNVLLKELIIPESVEEIGEMLLYYSTKIEKVRLPDNLEVLNRALFSNCWNLKEVNVPSKLRVLHDGVFEGCPDINRSVTKLPETLEIWDGTPYTGYEWFQEIVVVTIQQYYFPYLHPVTI